MVVCSEQGGGGSGAPMADELSATAVLAEERVRASGEESAGKREEGECGGGDGGRGQGSWRRSGAHAVHAAPSA